MSSPNPTDTIPRYRAEPVILGTPEGDAWEATFLRHMHLPEPTPAPTTTRTSSRKSQQYQRDEPERDNVRDLATIVSTVTNETVEWLWRRYLPLGYITILDGEPDKGKSLMTLDLIARVTTGGRMPDGTRGIEPAGAVLWTVEDGLADVIKPRLERAGADCDRIAHRTVAVDSEGHSRGLTVADTERMRRDIQRVNAKLVVLDPLSAFLGKADSHRDSDVRAALAPMQALLHEMGVGSAFVRHLTKAEGGSAMTRGLGTIAGTAVARSVLIVGREEQGEPMCVLARTKGNLGPAAPSLRYQPVGDPNDEDAPPWIEWHGVSDKTADELVAVQEPPSKLRDAEAFVREHLSDGPVKTDDLNKAAKSEGIADHTLRRAKEKLGVTSRREGMVGDFKSRLPEGREPIDAGQTRAPF